MGDREGYGVGDPAQILKPTPDRSRHRSGAPSRMSPVRVFQPPEPPREIPVQGGDDQEGEAWVIGKDTAWEIRHKFSNQPLIAPDIDREPRAG